MVKLCFSLHFIPLDPDLQIQLNADSDQHHWILPCIHYEMNIDNWDRGIYFSRTRKKGHASFYFLYNPCTKIWEKLWKIFTFHRFFFPFLVKNECFIKFLGKGIQFVPCKKVNPELECITHLQLVVLGLAWTYSPLLPFFSNISKNNKINHLCQKKNDFYSIWTRVGKPKSPPKN